MADKRAEWLRAAQKRLHPSITNPAYLVLRRRRLILERWLREIGGERLTVLDIGGRYQPYRPLVEGRIGRCVALDVERTEFVDVLGSGATAVQMRYVRPGDRHMCVRVLRGAARGCG